MYTNEFMPCNLVIIYIYSLGVSPVSMQATTVEDHAYPSSKIPLCHPEHWKRDLAQEGTA